MGGFHHCFFMCFHCLILIFTSVFWMFSSLIAFFHVTSFLYLDCIFPAIYQVLRFCVVVPRVLQIWESLFYPQVLFTLHYFPKFDTTCFYQGFPGSRQFFLEGCRASHWGSKHRPDPFFCLKHTVLSKRY